MKCLVTGGCGFIGSHLVERLLKDGNQVVVIDDLSTGKLKNLPKGNSNLKFCNLSINDNIDKCFKGVDKVFHLAAKTRPQESIKDPSLYNYVNIEGTLNVLNNCVKHKIKRLVFISSSSLYGTQEKLPTSETASPISMSPYALTKLIGEQYCKLFERLYGLQSNYIRPFNVFGTRQNPSGGYAAAVCKFIDMLKKGKTPYITGDGKQTRDFIFVEDVVDLILLASESKVYGEAFNAGSETNISINNLYELISKLMNKEDIIPDYIDEVFEPRITLASMNKAKKLLGWKSKTTLIDGLRTML